MYQGANMVIKGLQGMVEQLLQVVELLQQDREQLLAQVPQSELERWLMVGLYSVIPFRMA